MNNSALDTNKKRKAHMEHFMEFCALPPTRIAEIPLGLLYFPNKWVTTAFEWLSDGPLSEWMSDFKHNHPRIFWCTSVIWLPIILIAGLYGGLLVSAGAVWVVVFFASLAIVLVLSCKIIYVIYLFTHPYKRTPKL